MKILGVDTTGLSMSAAVTNGNVLLGEIFINNGKKHSTNFMPAVDDLLRLVDMDIHDMEAFAVTVGPGSFTGIRIGTAAVSALSYATGKPIYAVNTLDALLENVQSDLPACAIMDARRGEVYTAAVQGSSYIIQECAIPLSQLLQQLAPYEEVVFVGDGVPVHREDILLHKPGSRFAGTQFLLQRASSVCMCALNGKAVRTTHDRLEPHYLRVSQAERLKKEVR